MPLILVVDKDERVPGRVRQALGTGGWTVAHVREVNEALQSAGSEAPDLFLVSTELPSAGSLLATFARRQGGPGTLALVPDLPGGGDPAPGLGEDGALSRSFGETELRDAVERILRTPDRPVRAAGDEPKLTSQDIFGDLVAEVEREAEGRSAGAAPAVGVDPAAAPRPPAPRRPAKRPAMDDDIERKLEQTLSGVLGAAASASPPKRPAAPRPGGLRRDSEDLDKLISDTLSGLELPASPRKRRPEGAPPPGGRPATPAKPPPPERPAFDLEDLEALLARSRKASSTPPREAAPPAPTAPEPPAPRLGEGTGSTSDAEASSPEDAAKVPLSPLFAETMREVPEEEAAEAAEEGAPASSPARAGSDFGQYRLLDRIGVGGMAEVWKARMTGVEGFQKTVAIKRILPHLTDSTDFVDMFVDEAKLAAQLNHANIIHIYDLGKLGDDYYIAMEYVEGENLRSILNRAREKGGPLPPGVALHVAARLASALDYAHRKRDFEDRELGLVHRDVSPQNVLVGYEGTIKLCDFGIVKAVSKSSHTQMGALKGKLQYMSPEQAWGKAVDGRSDIFSLGALLFEMLTGRRLFVGESEMEVLEAVRECRVQAPSELVPDVSPEIDALVLKALAREPDDRFQTAGELERRLEEVLGAMRPTPGAAELAGFMARLFDRRGVAAAAMSAEPPAPEPARPSEAAREAPSAAGGEAPRPAGEPRIPPPGATTPEPPEPSAAGAGEAVDAVEPVRVVEPEEGGRRGKGLLVAAIVTAVVIGALLVWFLLQRGAPEGTGAPEPPAPAGDAAPPELEPQQEPPPADGAPEASGEEPGAGPEAAVAAAAPTAEGAEDAEAEAADDVSKVIDRAVEEELARREELLRKQFEAEERRLQKQLEELEESQREAPAASGAPPPEPPPASPPAPVSARPGPRSSAAGTAGEPGPRPAIGTGTTGVAVEASEPRVPPPEPEPPAPAASPRLSSSPPPPASEPASEPVPPPPSEPVVREGDLVSPGPGVQPPKLVRFEKPEYPPIARRLRVEGVVVVSILVDETGGVAEVRLVQSAGRDVGLDEAALEAARNAQYRPATRQGVRVKMWTTLRIPFKL